MLGRSFWLAFIAVFGPPVVIGATSKSVKDAVAWSSATLAVVLIVFAVLSFDFDFAGVGWLYGAFSVWVGVVFIAVIAYGLKVMFKSSPP